ncbi:hypothetical protein BDR03DRAFT_969898 [Suillus americanus]|nr:hypothetical protein BDR03DRAFT_969898 [Suillus americanus]
MLSFLQGLIFGFSYCLSYTYSRPLANAYAYRVYSIGLVLLCLDVGEVIPLQIVADCQFPMKEVSLGVCLVDVGLIGYLKR